jgi:hypothetical protein
MIKKVMKLLIVMILPLLLILPSQGKVKGIKNRDRVTPSPTVSCYQEPEINQPEVKETGDLNNIL